MAHLEIRDGDGAEKYIMATGTGTEQDPFVLLRTDTNSADMLAALQAIETAVEGTITITISGNLPDTAAGDLAAIVQALGGTLTVDGSGVTQPVSAASLPLPTGAATAANQATANDALTAIQTAVETLDDAVDGTELQVDVVASLPAGTNNIGDVDIASALPAGDNNIGNVDIASIAAGENHIGATGGHGVAAADSYTRPNDTNAYTAEDALSDSTSAPTTLEFAGCARVNGGTGVLSHVTMVDSANQSTKGEFELWLFDTEPTASNDNATFAISDTDAGNVVAVVPLETVYVGNSGSGADGNAIYDSGSLMRHFTCAAGDSSLYGLIKVTNAYTPVAEETLTVKLHILQD